MRDPAEQGREKEIECPTIRTRKKWTREHHTTGMLRHPEHIARFFPARRNPRAAGHILTPAAPLFEFPVFKTFLTNFISPEPPLLISGAPFSPKGGPPGMVVLPGT